MAANGPVAPALAELVRPHIDSFNWFITDGIKRVVDLLEPVEVEHTITGSIHRFWFENPQVGRPINEDALGPGLKELYPSFCREAGVTYRAPLSMEFCYQSANGVVRRITRRLGQLPIMVKSRACYLRHMSRDELVKKGEEGTEVGGYFICNGIERIIRMIILQRRHYIMALKRSSYLKRGRDFTEFATLLRCVRPDETSATVRCHYLRSGGVVFAFQLGRSEYFVPVGILLKALADVSDKELLYRLAAATPNDPEEGSGFVLDRAELVVRQPYQFGLASHRQAIVFLGSRFRKALGHSASLSDYEAGEKMMQDCVMVHLSSKVDKWKMLVSMVGKLWALAASACCVDSPDAATHQELLLPGHLLARFLSDQLAASLRLFVDQVRKDLLRAPQNVDLQNESYIRKAMDAIPDLGKKVEYLLNTGNLMSRNTLDLSQTSGFTVVAEKLNFFRFISHFRSVHRGAYFTEMRTTAVRKLLPESWGFMCPVHTPDGAPCGLLNHLTASCIVVQTSPDLEQELQALGQVLAELGVVPALLDGMAPNPPAYLEVQVEGRVVGYIQADLAADLVRQLNSMKAARLLEDGAGDPAAAIPPPLEGAQAMVPAHVEVVHIPYEVGGTFPGVFLLLGSARMVRPVRQLPGHAVQLVGTLEQSTLDIACQDGGPGGSTAIAYTHMEESPLAMLSVVASLTPFSDYNQSPRNMYQCQMGKQTLGTATQAYPHRTDGKLYRLQTPQTPIARTCNYSKYHNDEFPSGTNMIVAVLAYTGYDMEDAMILNKCSVERGLAHATVYKTTQVDLRSEKGKNLVFGTVRSAAPAGLAPVQGPFGERLPQRVVGSGKGDAPAGPQKADASRHHDHWPRIDVDGLPHVGAVIYPGQEYYCKLDPAQGKASTSKLAGQEIAVVDQVTAVGTGRESGLRQANIKMRFRRNPVIGDKFSSRHGQKGVLSVLYPDINMPFCASTGIRPDLIINPHAFPSRMTIGMLIESVVSKAGALDGSFVDATPFQAAMGKTTDPLSDCAAVLEKHGFSRLGGETMISGTTGQEFPADIFIGPVYYQRLRHMVSDKFQVRATGPVNPLTRQPIKGRKFGGGIRFGEMERDALLAHGAAYLLHDRLHWCSDYDVMDVCRHCGSLLAPLRLPHLALRASAGALPGPQALGKGPGGQVVCRQCGYGKHVERVALPHVFRFLATELAAMNIRCTLSLSSPS